MMMFLFVCEVLTDKLLDLLIQAGQGRLTSETTQSKVYKPVNFAHDVDHSVIFTVFKAAPNFSTQRGSWCKT